MGDLCDPDDDADTVPDEADNCPLNSNLQQEDYDDDTVGDACDPNIDGDNYNNDVDNCPTTPNNDQMNLDQDLLGDACDADKDGDGVDNPIDNCPEIYNLGQANSDDDADGNACDADDDNDGFLDASDNCPTVANPAQVDTDTDTEGDACDEDDDNDGAVDATDNCPLTYNAMQLDLDGDSIGTACDATIALPNSFSPANVAEITGAARGGTIAFSMTGSADCATPGSCVPPSVFSLQQGDYAVLESPWTSAGNAAQSLATPFVSEDGATYFSALTQTGTGVLQSAWFGALSDAVPTATNSLADLVEGPDGTYAAVSDFGTARLYRLIGGEPPVLLLDTQACTFSRNKLGSSEDETVYVTNQASNGQFTLLAYGDGPANFPLGEQQHQN